MRKKIILTIVLFLISLSLQVILIGTSPKVNCDEIKQQLYVFLDTLIIEYVFFILIDILFLKFLFKCAFKSIAINVLIFTLLFVGIFIYLFYGYYNEICN
ncbi:hypothetical protein SAMN05444372_112122 [Flavobacterium micromati]|uniref:Uncharacterized protein n=1 Tax=Flavobacterium micromati TaxID=229205 RepID=A0A1M5PAB2_9FLAO|nr:hypothetical protein SAMN05444372_112122 [Flavobacterium micromati]